MSKLLINESPLTFQPSLAVAIGLNEAIVLQQIHYWLNNKNNKGYEQDGYKWVFNTYAEWKESNFPFWSENTIQRTFASLEEMRLVVSIQPMKGKYDRTKYYRIEYTNLNGIEDTNLVRSEDTNLVRSLNVSETTEATAEKATAAEKTNIFKAYQDNIAMLTPIMSDKLKDAEKDYPAEWIVEAIGLCVANNKRNWNYAEAILKRWKADGKDEGKGKKAEAEKPYPYKPFVFDPEIEKTYVTAPPRRKKVPAWYKTPTKP